MSEYTAIVKRDGDWWIGWIEEVPGVALDRWLSVHGCELDREGSRHSWFINRSLNRRWAVPRHSEIRDELVRKILSRSRHRSTRTSLNRAAIRTKRLR